MSNWNKTLMKAWKSLALPAQDNIDQKIAEANNFIDTGMRHHHVTDDVFFDREDILSVVKDFYKCFVDIDDAKIIEGTVVGLASEIESLDKLVKSCVEAETARDKEMLDICNSQNKSYLNEIKASHEIIRKYKSGVS